MALSDALVRRVAPWRREAGRLGRRIAGALRRPRAEVIYDLGYTLPENAVVDPRRYERILEYLVREGCLGARQVLPPGTVSLGALARVHPYAYLERLGDPEVLVRIFGEEVRRVDGEGLVAAQRLMTAGTVTAARRALRGPPGGRLAVNLGGGFHHARADQGAGFCLVNDVAVAIHELRAGGFEGRVLVLDLDLHQGDGTRRIFAADPTVYTCSIHATDWDDAPAVADRNVALGSGIGDAAYLQAVRTHVPEAFRAAQPDLVFYVAGVDVTHDDRMGSWRVGEDAILARDRFVVQTLGDRPAVWVLAGGYGPEAWRHTARSLAWLLAGHDAPIPSRYEQDLRRFRRIAQELSRDALQGAPADDLILRTEDLLADLVGPSQRSRLLGFYSVYGLELALERYGVLPRIRAAGYPELELDLDTAHPTGERFRIFGRGPDRPLLLELLLKDTRRLAPWRLLSVEWLLLQSPRAAPPPDRPLLPGQRHPGLGCLRPLVLSLVMLCERLGFDGLLFSPAHYHVAAQARGLLAFLRPEDEARYAALDEALHGVPLHQATAIVHGRGLIDDDTEEVVTWQAAPMVLPVSERLRAHFADPAYQEVVEAVARNLRLRRRWRELTPAGSTGGRGGPGTAPPPPAA